MIELKLYCNSSYRHLDLQETFFKDISKMYITLGKILFLKLDCNNLDKPSASLFKKKLCRIILYIKNWEDKNAKNNLFSMFIFCLSLSYNY